jgi:ATP-dependent RNA helicase DBP3
MEDQLIKEKKEKKEKKRKNREKDEVVETVEESSTAAGGDLDDEEVAAKKARKEAKKLRKLGKSNVTEVVEEAPLEEEKIVKKVKKDKTSRESAILADVVGDLLPKKGGKMSSNNYVEHTSTTSMSSTEIATYREEVGLQVIPQEDSDKYNPMISFDYLNESLQNYCPDVKKYLKLKNFKKPSAIQAQCWPPLLSGRDVIGMFLCICVCVYMYLYVHICTCVYVCVYV